jgi:hypothetical protein
VLSTNKKTNVSVIDRVVVVVVVGGVGGGGGGGGLD